MTKKTFEEIILDGGGIPHNNNIVRTFGKWINNLNDQELFDISTSIVASFTLTSEIKSASILASQCIAVEKEISSRFKGDDEKIAYYINGIMNFAENIGKVSRLLANGGELFIPTSNVMDLQAAANGDENCARCKKTECPGNPDTEYNKEKDPNMN